MNKIISRVSTSNKSLEIGANNVAVIEFRQSEKGGTMGPFDIYNAYDSKGNLLAIEGFFLEDGLHIEYKNVRPERQPTLFDYM